MPMPALKTKSSDKRVKRAAATFAGLIVAAAATGCFGSIAEPQTNEKETDAGAAVARVEPLPPGRTHYGKSYAEWNSAWWQWYYRSPGSKHPVEDPTGEHCAVGQDPASPVFFLAGTRGGKAQRACTISSGKALFVPVLNVASDNGGLPEANWSTEAELEVRVNEWVKSTMSSSIIVDGVRIDDLHAKYMVPATRFKYDVPAGDNVYALRGVQNVSGPVNPSFSGGIYIMLPPLARGKHSVRFVGENTGDGASFAVDVSYELAVE